jgi:ribosomal protein S18 acetylase RimI-like enzyme
MNAKKTAPATPPARAGVKPAGPRDAAAGAGDRPLVIRPVRRGDLETVIAIDARDTGLVKRDYWRRVYRRYGEAAQGAQFLVAQAGDEVVGYIIGEVRDWEFGAPPCGWVFGIDVRPDARLAGIGTRLLEEMCATFRRAGVHKVRTILARENTLILSFFRSQGMTAGPFIPLQMDLEA